MYFIYYFMVILLLILVQSHVSFERAVIIGLALIIAEVWDISIKLMKKEGNKNE